MPRGFFVPYAASKHRLAFAFFHDEAFKRIAVVPVEQKRDRDTEENAVRPDQFAEVQQRECEPKREKDDRPADRDTGEEHESEHELNNERAKHDKERIEREKTRQIVLIHDIECELTV